VNVGAIAIRGIKAQSEVVEDYWVGQNQGMAIPRHEFVNIKVKRKAAV